MPVWCRTRSAAPNRRRSDAATARAHGLTTGAGGIRISVAVPRREIDRPALAALLPPAASLAILGLALGGAAFVQLRLGLRPLQRLRLAVEAIRHARPAGVPDGVPDELAPLARELTALANDTTVALAGARTEAANLAHASKTPVATLRLTLADDPAAQAQLDRIDATVRHHLARALADLAATIRRLHGERFAIALDVAGELKAAIGAQDLDELAGNLIDNAARDAAARVGVSARPDGRHVRIVVADDGPGIAAADRERASAPGARLDEAGDGHGFGLGIARELAALHGGTLSLSEAPGGGLRAEVTLPHAG